MPTHYVHFCQKLSENNQNTYISVERILGKLKERSCFKDDPLVVFWSKHLPTEWKGSGLNLVLSESF